MATIQTKLTSDNRQHDEAFKKSKQEVYNYQKKVDSAKAGLKSFAGGLTGKLIPALGLAGGALAAFNKTIRSTEQGADFLDRKMATMKGTVDKFFQSIATGNLNTFISDLKEIASTARDAYDALDNLGTAKMWKTARINQYQARIEQLKTNNSLGIGNKADNDKQIMTLQQRIDALTASLTGDTSKAAQSVLNKILGHYVGKETGQNLIKMRENGTLAQYASNYKNKHQTGEDTYLVNGQYIGKGWDNSINEEFYNAMMRLVKTTDVELQEYYNLLNEESQLVADAARKERKNLSSSGGKAAGSKTAKTLEEIEKWERDNPIEDVAPVVEMLDFYGNQQTWDMIADHILNDVEKPWLEVADAEMAAQKAMEDFQRDMNDLCNIGNSFATIFSNIGSMMDDDLGKGFNIAGIIASTIAELLKGYATASAESASYGPYGWAAFSLAGLAQVTAMISQIHSLSGYANGGIIGGNSYVGDRMLARVNSGEMILNQGQQANLFDMINAGGIGGGNVQFRISGSDLVGVLNNYTKKTGRVM